MQLSLSFLYCRASQHQSEISIRVNCVFLMRWKKDGTKSFIFLMIYKLANYILLFSVTCFIAGNSTWKIPFGVGVLSFDSFAKKKHFVLFSNSIFRVGFRKENWCHQFLNFFVLFVLYKWLSCLIKVPDVRLTFTFVQSFRKWRGRFINDTEFRLYFSNSVLSR